ncbi:flagellar protein FliS [Propionispira arboris]|uniref:Flagellar secretion chaperone FliS n=1 Tax=Propionispira arboris TaxID=84035 RepID=A0A1H7CEH6_9FIRM|nr:flagellar export chaperone FliS [Propionispira arboris]SEJ88109.1 flagellar protein FliS [Propionispira arboris]
MYNNAARTAETYRTQQVMTATPAELTLMLYNGAIKFTSESIKYLQVKNYEQMNTSCLKAQKIITEFMVTLKMDYDFSQDWLAIYDYIRRCLIEGNLKNDTIKLEEAKNLITELRNTWHEIIKIDKANKSGGDMDHVQA